MAYVRQRGKQLAIVHGVRDPETHKVEQRILFTIYSRAEALEALGRGERHGAGRFRSLLEHQYPDIKFDWPRIRQGIGKYLQVLPERYEYRSMRLRNRFRTDLCVFARQLLLSDPQQLGSSAQLIKEHRQELEYLAELIHWRIRLCEQPPSEWTDDNSFFWHFELRGRQVPYEAEEEVADLYERGEYEKAEVVIRLLIDCFDNYAEGYNYLGLIALDLNDLDQAIAHFEKTAEVGRKLFPKRLAKKHYWRELSTRPYMRGLRNLALTFNRMGRYDDALNLCDRLARECGDELTVQWYRAYVALNTEQWQTAAQEAHGLRFLDPAMSFIAAFARYELGRREDALASFLHGALNHPRAALMLTNVRTPKCQSHDEARDHNTGVTLQLSLADYFAHQSAGARRLFRRIVRDPRVTELLEQGQSVVRRWSAHRGEDRTDYRLMQRMHSPEFAREQVGRLSDLIPLTKRPKRRSRSRPTSRPPKSKRAS